ncbi:MAG: TRAP transporter small permease [Chloroflexota bacterium]
MDSFLSVIRRMTGWGMAVGAAFLTGMMILIVANVIYRLFGDVIPGSYEISTLMIVVTVAFALAYAAVQKTHVFVRILVLRFSDRRQAILTIFTSLISLSTWAFIAWASWIALSNKWLGELTDLLDLPYLPFRIIFVAGVALTCVVYLTDLLSALRQAVRR